MTDTPSRAAFADYGVFSAAPEGFDAQLIARRAQKGAPLLIVLRDDQRLEAMRHALSFFAPDLETVHFPAWDCLPYDRMSPRAEISAVRLATLSRLARGDGAAPVVVLTTLAALMQRVVPRDVMQGASFHARLGAHVDLEALKAYLVRMGFHQSPTVSEPGDYAIRGGIMDIFAPGAALPMRLDFWGDTLDAAHSFDPVSQRRVEPLREITLAPVSEVILDEESISCFRQNYRRLFGAPGRDDPLYEAVSAGRRLQGLEHWLPLFYNTSETLLSYLPQATIILDDRIEAAYLARWESIAEQYNARQEALNSRGAKPDAPYHPCPLEALYLPWPGFVDAAQSHPIRQLDPLPRPVGLGVIDAGGRLGRNFAPERQAEGANIFAALSAYLHALGEGRRIVIACYSEGARARLAGLLREAGAPALRMIDHAQDLAASKIATSLAVWPLEEGFETPDLVVISEQDVLGDRLIRKAPKRRRAENFLTEAQGLSVGDLVVHVDHGIGCYRGLDTITAAGAPHECLLLEYANNDRLYLPVENIELLSRYGHEEGLLDRLGGGAWQAKKARLKARIREIADQLIRIAAEREMAQAPVLLPPHEGWEAFCARFPYIETDDQLAAIEDVLSDLAAGRPMDRLICGDVGFGKTEVALRAAYVAAMSGMQVAVIVPTTLLARQHAKSFQERFRGLPLRIRQLSRFVSAKEAAQTRADLAEGKVDIVIGTHALLAKGVQFRDLGLLIVDEEQHFGVTHKERLKSLKADIHVLTLTATPIPRTLQLSLSGVRDLSVIATPPVDRLAIRTYPMEFDTITIREALLREHYRGGQSFYVVPRISDLPDVEAFLRDQVPEVSFVIAHGQMPATELDDVMNAFYDGKFDVLVATTIVESGLDIPTANTMIVHRADMFGLAQLYQIRGRIGRSKTRAYAYLTTKPRVPLTPAAQKRLRVLGAMDQLGAGFNLASQDLDLRGAGNILGDQQSGHVREVGYELYQEMLQEAIAKIRAGEMGMPEQDMDWAPQINLNVPVMIPAAYIPDLDLRLAMYRRLSALSKKVELEGFAAELIDRFGPLPEEVNTLMMVIRIKHLCKRAMIARLDMGPKGATIVFHQDKFPRPEGLVRFIQAQKGLAKIRENKLVVQRDYATETARLKGAFLLARELALEAKPPKGKNAESQSARV